MPVCHAGTTHTRSGGHSARGALTQSDLVSNVYGKERGTVRRVCTATQGRGTVGTVYKQPMRVSEPRDTIRDGDVTT